MSYHTNDVPVIVIQSRNGKFLQKQIENVHQNSFVRTSIIKRKNFEHLSSVRALDVIVLYYLRNHPN